MTNQPEEFRKKPVVIEAMQWTGDNFTPLAQWCWKATGGPVGNLLIETLEGTMTASVGDYIIRGVQGEFYPCKPDIFASTYEPADATLPNLLDGTTLFMQRARQLGTAGRTDMWPSNMPEGLRELRRTMLVGPEGEVQEYIDGEDNDDIVEVVDGLLDTIVIAWGTLLAYVGEDKAKAAAAEVVRTNLAKVIGPGLPLFREDGKVIKPPGWTAPDIAGAIADPS